MSKSSRTDWEGLAKLSDDEIDYSDIPPLDQKFFGSAVLRIPADQARQMVSVDADVLDWFRAKNANYVSEINSISQSHVAKFSGVMNFAFERAVQACLT